MNLGLYLTQTFSWHALLAGTLVAIICGLIGPCVISRGMAFAVHGTSELAFTGASAGLLVANNPIAGAFVGALVVAGRDSSIGVILAFGLGLGVLLLSYYHGFATEATNILFGNIFGVGNGQLLILLIVGIGVTAVMAAMYRPLLFASIDPEVAQAKGVRVRLLGIIFLFILALTVTAAAQIVGTLLVLSLAITPAAAATRLSSRPRTITIVSIVFALIACDGGIIASLASGTIKASVFVTGISFALYVFARIIGPSFQSRSANRM
jgi:zinc/manganese transport system permease protein